MRSTAKISLEKRLQELPTKQANFLRVFELPIDSYFYDWDRRFGGSYFASVLLKRYDRMTRCMKSDICSAKQSISDIQSHRWNICSYFITF